MERGKGSEARMDESGMLSCCFLRHLLFLLLLTSTSGAAAEQQFTTERPLLSVLLVDRSGKILGSCSFIWVLLLVVVWLVCVFRSLKRRDRTSTQVDVELLSNSGLEAGLKSGSKPGLESGEEPGLESGEEPGLESREEPGLESGEEGGVTNEHSNPAAALHEHSAPPELDKPAIETRLNGSDKGGGRRIEKLVLTEHEIGKGNEDGSVCFLEGIYGFDQLVNVKCISKSTFDREDILDDLQVITGSHDENVIKSYGFEEDDELFYICLEPWTCNLQALINFSNRKFSSGKLVEYSPSAKFEAVVNSLDIAMKGKYLGKYPKLPTPLLIKLLRDIVYGINDLHRSRIVHGHLTPENVFIVSRGEQMTLIPKLANMVIHMTRADSQQWLAPEQNGDANNKTFAGDIFSLGFLLYYTLTGGLHPYGRRKDERDRNIEENNVDISKVRHIPGAVNLISRLLDRNPQNRLSAAQVRRHPLFWSRSKRLDFFRDASDKLEGERKLQGSAILVDMHQKRHEALGTGDWIGKIDTCVMSCSQGYRTYHMSNVCHLARFIRNTYSHYEELDEPSKVLVGTFPEGVDEYFSLKFPNLVMVLYDVIFLHCGVEHRFKRYFT